MGSADSIVEVHHGGGAHWLHRDCVDTWQKAGCQPAPESPNSMCILCGKSFPKDEDHNCRADAGGSQ